MYFSLQVQYKYLIYRHPNYSFYVSQYLRIGTFLTPTHYMRSVVDVLTMCCAVFCKVYVAVYRNIFFFYNRDFRMSVIPKHGHDWIKTSSELRTISRDLRKRNLRNVDKEKTRYSNVSRCFVNIVSIHLYVNETSADTRVTCFFLVDVTRVTYGLCKSDHIVQRYGALSWPRCDMKLFTSLLPFAFWYDVCLLCVLRQK